MKLHILTIGTPKLPYARLGWDEYLPRLRRFHTVRVTHLPDKKNSSRFITEAIGSAYTIALAIDGSQFSSPALAAFFDTRALEGREVCCVIGGPDGLPNDILRAAHTRWSLSSLTFPHDLAMVLVLEALYRASTISAGHPYHK